MSDGKYPSPAENLDDLPRTLRRERELRDRAAREQQLKDQSRPAQPASSWDRGGVRPEPANPYDTPNASAGDDPIDATVRRLKVPFISLAGFYIKSVFAAIPALLLLIAMLYALGVALQTYFPWIIKTKIVITFPG